MDDHPSSSTRRPRELQYVAGHVKPSLEQSLATESLGTGLAEPLQRPVQAIAAHD